MVKTGLTFAEVGDVIDLINFEITSRYDMQAIVSRRSELVVQIADLKDKADGNNS